MEGQNNEEDNERALLTGLLKSLRFSLSIQAGVGGVPVCAVMVGLLSNCVHGGARVLGRYSGPSLNPGSSAH